MRYFLELRYNGAAYCGWQRQPDMPSVQQTLERALTTLLREKIEVTGAGPSERMRTRVSRPANANTVTISNRARIPLRGMRRGSITCRWTWTG